MELRFLFKILCIQKYSIFVKKKSMGTYCVPWSEYTISGYIASKPDMLAKIAAIDNLMDVFLASMLDSFSGPAAGTQSYELDDGQVRVKTSFRSINEMKTALQLLRIEKNKYINDYNGRCSVAQDKRSFI
jgi:hypothetical protein